MVAEKRVHKYISTHVYIYIYTHPARTVFDQLQLRSPLIRVKILQRKRCSLVSAPGLRLVKMDNPKNRSGLADVPCLCYYHYWHCYYYLDFALPSSPVLSHTSQNAPTKKMLVGFSLWAFTGEYGLSKKSLVGQMSETARAGCILFCKAFCRGSYPCLRPV